MTTDLDELEQRIAEKWARVAAERMPQWEMPDFPFDMSAWNTGPTATLPPGTLQFPREQWATYPNRRTLVLITLDHLLDFPELTDEQWSTACFLMQYGGKTRLS